MIRPRSLTQEAKVVKDITNTVPQREGVTPLCWLTTPPRLLAVGAVKPSPAPIRKPLAALLDPKFGKGNVRIVGKK